MRKLNKKVFQTTLGPSLGWLKIMFCLVFMLVILYNTHALLINQHIYMNLLQIFL